MNAARRPHTGMVTRAIPWLSVFGLLIFLASATWLGRLEQAGPAHAELLLDGGIPATIHLPGPKTGRGAFVDPPPRGERPAAVVLMHGFASDRLGLSTLARRLASAGYAVLTFDARGHGQNRNPFGGGRGRADTFYSDYVTAVDFLRGYPLVDGARIAVMGHSMGAGASLDFATRDAGIDAAVLISGGWSMQGPHRPPNTLFLYASGDPERIKRRSAGFAARLAGAQTVETGRTYGDPSRGTGVRLAEVPGADHATIVWTAAAAHEITSWLDAVFRRERAAAPVPSDPRLTAALVSALSLLLVLPGLGLVIGRLVRRLDERAAGSGARGLGLLAAALVATMPLLALDTPAAVLSIEVGDRVVSHFALAGIALLVFLALRGDSLLRGSLAEPGRIASGAILGAVAVYVFFLPLGAVVHRMTLTPERTAVFFAAWVLLLPFGVAFQCLLRCGTPARAALQCGLGRVLVLAVLVLGVNVGLLSGVVLLMLPAFALIFVLFELLSASIYAASRNLPVIALIDAAWLALVVAAVMPIRI